MDMAWSSLITNIIVSVLVIYFIHNLWNYLRDTYTVKKKKDLVDFQTKKYREMLAADIRPKEYSSPDFISDKDKEWMIEELSEILSS